jgi:hypothetical protein
MPQAKIWSATEPSGRANMPRMAAPKLVDDRDEGFVF